MASYTASVLIENTMNSTPLSTITSFLDSELSVASYSDNALNGLQIESPVNAVHRIAFAVDAGVSVLEEAASAGAQLLVVHHGLFWGTCEPITGALARKVSLCMHKGLSLYASHLPLDGHLIHGNAAQLGNLLGLTSVTPCFEYKGATIGVSGTLREATPIQAIADRLAQCEGVQTPPLVLPFGKDRITSIGIATGSATSFIPHTVRLGLDLLITGEPKQECFHTAKDIGCSVICMGHYASETFGVRALERVLKEKFRVETTWINQPTGI